MWGMLSPPDAAARSGRWGEVGGGGGRQGGGEVSGLRAHIALSHGKRVLSALRR